jgi:type I restriction enzyme S subunit
MAVWSTPKLSALATGLRLDAEYYQPRFLADARTLANTRPQPIASFARVTDGIHASPDEVEEGGVRYLSAKCVKDNAFVLGNALHISQSQHAANPRTSLCENDILITTVGTIGNAAVVQSDILPANADRHLGIVRIKPDADVDPYYLSSFLNCEYGRFQSLREATGNVQLNLFIEKIRELRVPILPCAGEVARHTRAAYEKRRRSTAAIAAAEKQLMAALGLADLDLMAQKHYVRHFRDLEAGNRFGAEYYMPCKKRVLDALAKLPHRTIADHAQSIREMWDPKRAPKSLSVHNFDITDALEPFLDDAAEPQSAEEIGSAKKLFRGGDVVISRLRSYLKEIAVVRTSDTLLAVGSSEFIVLRPTGEGVSPETLMVFLRCPLVQTVLKWSQDGSNHPRFAEEDLLAIPLPNGVLRAQNKIDGLVHEAIEARRHATRLLEQAKKTIEDTISGEADGKGK